MGNKLACALGLVLVLAIPVGADEPPRASQAAPASGTGRVVEIRVVERDGEKPVAGVAIDSLPGSWDKPAFRGATDDQGRCVVPVPPDAEKSHHFAVQAWKDGFVPVRVLWGQGKAYFEGIPAAYTVLFDRGTPIGGVVLDEQGRPLAGARVVPAPFGRRGEIEYLDLPWDAGFTTDAQGRWRGAMLPATWKAGPMGLRVEHPRFVNSGRAYDHHLSITGLRALSAVIVLKTGYTLSGTVVDAQGRPIEGATVVWPGVYQADPGLRVKTGVGGRFRFENGPPGIALITAEAPGLATSVKLVQLGPHDPPYDVPPAPPAGALPVAAPLQPVPSAEMAPQPPAMIAPFPFVAPSVVEGATLQAAEGATMAPQPYALLPAFLPNGAKQLTKDGPCDPPLVFRLGPGRTIRGRVVDLKGRPIAGARVTPEFRDRSDLYGWRAETDADGRFLWTNAPPDEVVLKVENPAEGQEFRSEGPGTRDGEIVITMPAPFRLRGKVVDAETNRPIDRFRIVEGVVWTHDFAPDDDGSPPDWSDASSREVAGGSYEARFPRWNPADQIFPEYPVLVIRIEAEGYAPAISRRYYGKEGEQSCDFALRKQPWIKGAVRAPDGSPVAGAEVVVAVKGRPLPQIYNGRLTQGWKGETVKTGPDGRFAFAKPDEGGRVVILSDRGLAQRTTDELAAEPVVTLEPWGRIRGQVRVGTGVGARRLVGAEVWDPDHRGDPVVTFFARAPTDAEGRFAMDRVAPGHVMVYRPSWTGDNKRMRSHRQGVDVGAGQTAEVMMGGAGRPVVGRLTRAAGLPDFELEHVKGQLRIAQPSPDFPEDFAEWDAARKQKWWNAFYRTEEGRRYYEGYNTYAVKVEPDGSFRLDDVPEGRYWLELSYRTDASDPNSDQEHTPIKVAVLEEYVEVSAGPDEKPFDLGTLTLTPPEPEVIKK